ncbi:TPA: winged helix-turn-helix transcriptional regulator [Candidatus Woesearchaeota archaeon]|nr:winged helix-turn-helix transcriptional regulator [Candidatus Woesearchaeota archaeon]HII68778.1 winged helix-turn-helix transcriptional regulator [Candidatus Woesearchaeota archaeon]
MSGVFLTDKEKQVLSVEARRRLYRLVREHAGLHFREIERKSLLPTGTVQYHLGYLCRQGLLKSEKDSHSLRYFPMEFTAESKQLMAILRQRSMRSILLFLLAHHGCSHEEITKSVKLAPSTVSWHLRKLEDAGAIASEKDGRKTRFSLLINSQEVINLLITYKKSFLDSVVDNVIEMWESR